MRHIYKELESILLAELTYCFMSETMDRSKSSSQFIPSVNKSIERCKFSVLHFTLLLKLYIVLIRFNARDEDNKKSNRIIHSRSKFTF